MLIAGWSGPRNLSTAMMYAFAQRPDCTVVDEPFYASFLKATGLTHPMRQEILTDMNSDATDVVDSVTRYDSPHRYLKLMTHHILPSTPLAWAGDAVHLHLIRHPARVIASYTEKNEVPELDDIGLRQQLMLYERFGGIVLDSADIRADPGAALRKACAELGLTYTDAMLHWPAGGNAADGIWARHWYDAVHRSTGFAEPEGALPVLSGAAARVCAEAVKMYDELHARRLAIT